MKPSALLLCLLLVLLSPHGLAEPATIPTACCFTLINKRLTLQNLESYRRITSSKCPHKAVIFKTIQGKMICTDPKQKWVQTFMKILDQKLQLHRPT